MKKTIILVSILFLSSCSAFMIQRYNISVDNVVALKKIGVGNIYVGAFKKQSRFEENCRTMGPVLPPANMTFETYIRKALIDELKFAGIFDEKTPKVILSGMIKQLTFSAASTTLGSWDIGLLVNSSNGKSIYVIEHYEFDSGFSGQTACKQTASAFLPAVQNLIGKLVKSPEFKGLVTP
jgi:hypothetical protein